ncbi:unnamed protein product [Ectocarpus sp. 8 AP-2014]
MPGLLCRKSVRERGEEARARKHRGVSLLTAGELTLVRPPGNVLLFILRQENNEHIQDTHQITKTPHQSNKSRLHISQEKYKRIWTPTHRRRSILDFRDIR